MSDSFSPEKIRAFIDAFSKAIRNRDYAAAFMLPGLGVIAIGGWILSSDYDLSAWGALPLALGFVFLFWGCFIKWRRIPPVSDELVKITPHSVKGAACWTEVDADLFARLGRKGEISQLHAFVLDDRLPLLVVRGETGVGKTSLLRAGLKASTTESDYEVIYWEASPRNAEASLLHAIRSSVPEANTVGLGAAKHDSLRDALNDLTSKRIVLVLDQLEQLSPHKHDAIFELIRTQAQAMAPFKLKLILGFREEFMSTWYVPLSKLPSPDRDRVVDLLLNRFRQDERNDEAVEVLETILAASEKPNVDRGLVKELISSITVQGSVSPTEVSILAWMLQQTGAHKSTDLKLLGGVESLFRSYLELVLKDCPDRIRGKILTAMISSLVDPDNPLQRSADGALAEEMAEAVEPRHKEEFCKQLERLSLPGVRVLEKIGDQPPRHRLMHERLIEPLRQLTGTLVPELEQARLILNRHFANWEGDFSGLLQGKQLSLVRSHAKQLLRGADREVLSKHRYLRRSLWIARLRRIVFATSALFIVATAGYFWHASERERCFEELRYCITSSDTTVQDNAIRQLHGYEYADDRIVPALVAAYEKELKNASEDYYIYMDHADCVAMSEYARWLVSQEHDKAFTTNPPLPDTSSQIQGIALLGDLGSDDAVAALIKALGAEKDDVKRAAALALGKIGNDKAVAPLVKAMHAECGMHKNAAAEALLQIGSPAAFDAWIAAIEHESNPIGEIAAQALVALGDRRAIDPLIQIMQESHRDPQRRAAWALGKLGDDSAVEALASAMNSDKSWHVREAAIEALGCIGSDNALGRLIEFLKNNPQSEVSEAAVRSLGWIGSDKAITVLISALKGHGDHDWHIREAAERSLVRIGSDKAFESLMEMLNSEENYEKRVAASLLGTIAGNRTKVPISSSLTNEAEGLLCDMLKSNDKSEGIHDDIVKTLGHIGTEESVGPLIASLQNLGWESRGVVYWALGEIGSEEAVPALGTALTKRADEQAPFGYMTHSYDVRLSAASALGKIKSEAGVKPLVTALGDNNWEICEAAANALCSISSDDAIEPLVSLVEYSCTVHNNFDDDYCVNNPAPWDAKYAAAKALRIIGSDEAVEELLRLSESGHGRFTTTALIAIGDDRVVQTMIKMLGDSDSDSDKVKRAVLILGEIGSEDAVEPLVKLFSKENLETRVAVVDALGKIGGKTAVLQLIKAIQLRHADIQEAAATALGKIGDKDAISPLIIALNNGTREVRAAAAESLGKLPFPESQKAARSAFDDLVPRVRRAALEGLVQCESPNLSEADRAILPYDPLETISAGRIRAAAREFGLSEANARKRAEALAKKFGLKIESPARKN